jgi:hypothetical protein
MGWPAKAALGQGAPCPLPLVPPCLWKGKGATLPLYKGTLGGELDTSGLRKFLGKALLSSSCDSSLPLTRLSLSRGSPKGCVGVRSTPPLHVVVLQEFRIRSKPIYFRNLGWVRDPEGVIVHRMCASTTRCCTCGTKSLRRCCRTSVVTSRSPRP